MFIDAALLPTWLVLLTGGLLLFTLLPTLWCADWRALSQVPGRIHLLLGGAVFCVVLWLLSVRVIEGLWIHFLGITTLTLVLGWRFAIVGGTLATLVYTLVIGQSLSAMPTSWLLTVAIPATLSRYLVFRLRQVRQRNLFVYMLGAGFGGGLLSGLGVAIASLCVFWRIERGDWISDALRAWPLISLMLFPEGFINGMVVTTLAVFYPQSLKTLDESHYIDDRES
jgi:uncharacterized membrane protein